MPSNGDSRSPDVSLASLYLITPSSWQTLRSLGSDHLPILIRLHMKPIPIPGRRCTYINHKNAKWDRYIQEIEDALSKISLPTDCQKHQKIFRSVLINSVVHNLSLLIPVRGGDHLLLGFTSYEITELIDELAIMWFPYTIIVNILLYV